MKIPDLLKTYLQDIYSDVTLYLIAIVISLYYRSQGPWVWLGYVLIIISIPCWLIARYQLGSSFSVTARAKKLVTTGFYHRLRNPIYFFTEVANLGLALVFNNPYIYTILVIHMGVQLWRSHKEAEVLRQAFGQVYDDYLKTTWF